MNPLVSVIIPTYNSASFIRKTLESALAQTYKPIEVIMVDDGSIDNTSEVAKRYINSSTNIKYIYKKNGGPASARNLGIENAKGEYLAFLDSDDVWHPEKLQRQIDLFSKDKSLGLVYTHCIGFRDDSGELLPPKGEMNNGDFSSFIFSKLFWQNFIANSSVVVRKQCLQKIGLFDEGRDFIAVEDYDLWLRICKDYKAGYINKTLVKYRIHKKGISRKENEFYLRQKKVIEKTINNCPDIERITGISIKGRFGKLYFDYGLDLLKDARLKEAKNKFLISLKYHPYNVRSLINLLKCLLPLKLFVMLRHFRNKLSAFGGFRHK